MRSYVAFKSAVAFLGLTLCLFLASVPASAQVVNGSISGTVVDPTGAVIVGATVTAVNTQTNATTNATTTSSGAFLIAGLAVGTYNVTVTKSGFQTVTQANISVTAATDRGLGNIKMPVGSSSTTVEVTSGQPLLETTQAQVSTAFNNTDLTNFPGLNANAGLDNLATYLPGVNMARGDDFSNSNGPDFTVNGIRSRFNDQQIDGQNNNDNSVAGPSFFVASPLFVQEYQVITDNFGPEYGRNSGSVVNEITKSGTNTWHGTILGTESNNYVDALSNTQIFDDDLNGPPRFNDEFTGGGIGGPIWKNHLFVFGGFDNEIVSSTGVFEDGAFTPTTTGLGELAACFPSSAAVADFNKYAAFAIGAFSPQQAPGTTATFPGVFEGVTLPAITANGTTCPTVQMAFPERVAPNGSHEYDWDYRMDAVVNDSDRFFGRYMFQKTIDFNDDDVASGYPFNIPALTQTILLDETHTFTSTMVNDFRIGFSRANIDFGSNSLGDTVPAAGQLTNALTNVTIENFAGVPFSFQGFGPPTNIPQSRILSTWQGQDNWSWLQGKNQWKAGVNYTYQRTINTFFPDINGQFTFANWDAVAANTPLSVSVGTGNPVLDFREHDLFMYAGDDYKLKSNLTLNLGLTWTYFGSPENLFNQITTANETGPNPLFNPALPLSVRTFPSFPPKYDLFGESVGFAWTPQGAGWLTGNGKTVIRGGFRETVDPAYYNIFINMSTSTPLVLLNTVTGGTAAGFPLPADPFGPTVRADLAPILPVGTTDPRATDQTTIPNSFQPDEVREWSFGIQRQINPHLVVESRYVGNHGADLFQSINANPLVCNTDITEGTGTTGTCLSGMSVQYPALVPAGVTPCLGPVGSTGGPVVANASGRENCNEGVLDEFANSGYSDYEGWQNEVRATNLFNQLTVIGNYTWSKTTDNTTETYSTFADANTVAYAQNPFNVTSAEHGLSGIDFPQQFTVQGYWNVPLYRSQHGVVGHALGGWSVGLGYQLVSGDPFTPSQLELNTLTGGTTWDEPFDLAFIGIPETARPFAGSASAPSSQVGIFAGDACSLFGGASCGLATSTLLSFNALNTTGATNTVTNGQVRYIVNGTTADSIFGTPFGNGGRNTARDYHTNTANIAVFRTFKFSERVNLQARLDMLNAFNHPNYDSVGPFIEGAGLTGLEGAFGGFADPQNFPDGPRVIKGGLQITF
jgi:Carboxypeptidase regulatory-like domain